MGQCTSVLDQCVGVEGEETLLVEGEESLLVAGELSEEESESVNTPAGRYACVTK